MNVTVDRKPSLRIVRRPAPVSRRTIVSETLWGSLPSVGKFAALGLGYRPAIRPACRCLRCH